MNVKAVFRYVLICNLMIFRLLFVMFDLSLAFLHSL